MPSKLQQIIKILRSVIKRAPSKKIRRPPKVSGSKKGVKQPPKEPASILTAIRNVWLCIKILNFIPITFPTDFKHQPHFNMSTDAIQVGIFVILLIVQLWIFFFVNIFISRSILLDLGKTTMIVFGTILMPFNSMYTVWTRDKIWVLLNKMDFIDREFQNLGITVNYPRHRRITLWILVLHFGLFLFSLWLDEMPIYENDVFNPFLLFIKFNAYGCILMVQAAFIFLLASVYTRFKYLNKCIQNYFHLNLEEDIVSVLPHRSQEAVYKFSKIYENLIDIVDLVNFTYGIKAMLCFGLFFVYTVFTSFATYWMLIKFNENDLHSFVSNCLWNLIFGGQVLVILVFGSNIFSEGGRLIRYVFWAMNTTSDELIIARLFEFSQQIRHRTPVISCGLFSFDYTVLYTMAASLATYLIILIQFERSSNAINFNTTTPTN